MCFIGRLSSIKHVEDFVLAFNFISNVDKSVNAFVIGEGPKKEYLIKIAKKSENQDRIKFTGYLNEDEKNEIVSRSILFVMPSEREGFSIATLEAMYYGAIPVVALPNQKELFGMGEFIKNGENSLTFSVGDVKDLVTKITTLIRNVDLQQRLRINAMKTSRQYSWDKSGEKLRDSLNKFFNLN